VILAGHLIKGLRPPFSSNYLITHRRLFVNIRSKLMDYCKRAGQKMLRFDETCVTTNDFADG
jgi:hypothetical protein